MELKEINEVLDKLILNFFDELENYFQLRNDFEKHLTNGFILIAKVMLS